MGKPKAEGAGVNESSFLAMGPACSRILSELAESSLIAVWLEQRSLGKRTATNQLHENKDSSLCRVGSAQPLQRAGQYGSQWQDAATEAFCDPGRHSSG